jgi:hypothetical protein
MGEKEVEKCCCRKMGKDEIPPTLVKSIEAVYKLSFCENNGVVQQLVSPYDVSESVQSSSAMGSSRAKVPAKINLKCAVDKDGFEDMSSFWKERKEMELNEAAYKTAEDNANADVRAVSIMVPPHDNKIVQEMDKKEFKNT